MLLYGELSILQDSNMVKKKSRPQTNAMGASPILG